MKINRQSQPALVRDVNEASIGLNDSDSKEVAEPVEDVEFLDDPGAKKKPKHLNVVDAYITYYFSNTSSTDNEGVISVLTSYQSRSRLLATSMSAAVWRKLTCARLEGLGLRSYTVELAIKMWYAVVVRSRAITLVSTDNNLGRNLTVSNRKRVPLSVYKRSDPSVGFYDEVELKKEAFEAANLNTILPHEIRPRPLGTLKKRHKLSSLNRWDEMKRAVEYCYRWSLKGGEEGQVAGRLLEWLGGLEPAKNTM